MKHLVALLLLTIAGPFGALCSGQEKVTTAMPPTWAKAFAPQDPASTANSSGKNGKKEKKSQGASSSTSNPSAPKIGNPALPDPLDCSKLPVHVFTVDISGSVSDTGKMLVGPACVEVYFNPIQSAIFLQSNLTTVAGPDINKSLFSAAPSGGAVTAVSPVVRNITEAFYDIYTTDQSLRETLNGRKVKYVRAMNAQDIAIAAIAQLRSTTLLLTAGQQPSAVLNGYQGLQSKLKAALDLGPAFSPTDQSDENNKVLIFQLQQLATRLNTMPLDFADGPKTDPASISLCKTKPTPEPVAQIPWADWSTHCKDQYDALNKQITADIQDAQTYSSPNDTVKQLKAKMAVVQYWNSLFINMGLNTSLEPDDFKHIDISLSFHASKPVRCGILFNQTGNTTVNILAADLGPTLDGTPPTIKAQGAFTTVTCATPFALSAGVGFSTIEQKEFAIVKSNGGAGNPSVNTFQSLSDSRIHPMPIAMMHVRLKEWGNHVYALHGSFGVAGNLQGQSSGGSAAEFLPSASISFWRTMFVSVCPHIGTESALAGGFHEGDTVPSDITTIQGQVKRSYTVGFGFAITFTKP
jgi:hypothetical protein